MQEDSTLHGEPTMDELKQELRELTSLRKSQGWDRYRKLLEAQLESRKATIVHTPLKRESDVWAQEYLKGELSGIYQTLTLLGFTIESLEAEIQDRKENEGIDNED